MSTGDALQVIAMFDLSLALLLILLTATYFGLRPLWSPGRRPPQSQQTVAPAAMPFSLPFLNPRPQPPRVVIPPRPRGPRRPVPPRPGPANPVHDVPAGFLGRHDPTAQDVLAVKKCLSAAGSLPTEVVDIIMDHAEYWVCSTTSVSYENLPHGHLSIRNGGRTENAFLLRTRPLGLTEWVPPENGELWHLQSKPLPLQAEYETKTLERFSGGPGKPSLEHPCRRIVFDITSCDQGWGGERHDQGTYHGSWTWFDAGLERFDAKAECPPDCSERSSNATDTSHSEKPCSSPPLPTCTIRPVWPSVNTDERSGAPEYDHELHPTPAHRIISNPVAQRGMTRHVLTWDWDDDIDPASAEAEELALFGRGVATKTGEFVRGLKLGDLVTVWGRARFHGWTNNVERVEVKVYWAV